MSNSPSEQSVYLNGRCRSCKNLTQTKAESIHIWEQVFAERRRSIAPIKGVIIDPIERFAPMEHLTCANCYAKFNASADIAEDNEWNGYVSGLRFDIASGYLTLVDLLELYKKARLTERYRCSEDWDALFAMFGRATWRREEKENKK